MKRFICFLTFGTLLISANVFASILTVGCDNFNGPALYYKDGKLEVQNDGYKNTTWTFIIDSDHPSEVTYLNRGQYVGSISHKTKVIFHNEYQITLLEILPKAVWLYSIYPEQELAYMTVHKPGTLGRGEAASANTSFSKCSFTKDIL